MTMAQGHVLGHALEKQRIAVCLGLDPVRIVLKDFVKLVTL
jgi:hypothetical protein